MALERIQELEHILGGLGAKITNTASNLWVTFTTEEGVVVADAKNLINELKQSLEHLEDHVEELVGLKKAEAPAEQPAETTAAV